MGNSAAILLPKPVLAHLNVSTGDTLQMDLQEGRVVLSQAARHPRAGWAEAAKALSGAGNDQLEWPDLDAEADEDWTW